MENNGQYRPDWIYITKCPLDVDAKEVFDNARDEPELTAEIDKFLAAREDLKVHERIKNCVQTDKNYYIALYGRDFAHIAPQ